MSTKITPPYDSYMDAWSIKFELNCNAKNAQIIFLTLLSKFCNKS